MRSWRAWRRSNRYQSVTLSGQSFYILEAIAGKGGVFLAQKLACLDKALSAGDEIVVKFPSGYSVDKRLDESDVTLEDDDGDEYDIESVEVSGKTTVTIELDDKIKKNALLILTIDNVTNPRSRGDYKISVRRSEESSYKSEEIKPSDRTK